MKWFRMYHSVLDSIKVRTLPDDAQLDYWLLLCCASEYRETTNRNTGETGLTVERAAWRLRRGTLEGTFPLLQKNGLVRLNSAREIVLIDWKVRQFGSDDVAARTLKHKRKHAKNGNGNVPVNVGVNVRDTDTDTEVKTLSRSQANDDDASKAVLAYLNEKTGKHFRPGPTTSGAVQQRLAEGATPDDCRKVIDAKSDDWLGDPKMSPYLRPKTLFNRTNFAQYVGALASEETRRVD